MIVNQIRSTDGTGTLSYFLIDEKTNSGILIDPNKEDIEVIKKLVSGQRANVTHIIDTHTHADHITGAGELAVYYRAHVVMHESTKDKWTIINRGDVFGIGDILRENAKVSVDRYVNDGDVIPLGDLGLTMIHTPGHTDNHISPYVGGCLFTGDILLIGQAGRSDLPGGNVEHQYHTLFNKILTLPDETIIYPGHDYADNISSTLAHEKEANPFLKTRTQQEFVDFVKEYFPPLSESIEGGKVTLQCGVTRVSRPDAGHKPVYGDELYGILEHKQPIFLLDVREPFELIAFGTIQGVVNIPIGELNTRLTEIPLDTSLPIVCVCQSGNRSLEAAHLLSSKGFTNVMNLEGGIYSWKRSGFPVVKPGRG